MKKLVISLLRRADRKVEFQKNNLQNFEYIQAIDGEANIFRHIQARPNWLDPFQNRPLQQNEVACFLSHINAWQKCIELNQPVIVMEDDAMINNQWNEALYQDLINEYDFVYLQHNENEPSQVTSINDLIERPSYPYNMTTYCIKPTTAQSLLHMVNYSDFIPVDEFLPEVISKNVLKIVALKEDSCNQIHRSLSQSDIENNKPFRPYKVHAVTCGTDRKKCTYVNTSARKYGIDIVNVGTNIEWQGTDMSALGGGMKINLMKDYVKDLHDDDIILFTDAYDVFYADDLETITERFLEFGKEIVFSGELFCYPHEQLASEFPDAHTRFKYINSGTYIGRVGELKKLYSHEEIEHWDDDQLYVHKCFLYGDFDIAIDYECYIFQTHFEGTIKLGDQLNNPETRCCPCIYHGNGGQNTTDKFLSLYNEFHKPTSAYFIPHNKIEYLSEDMLVVDFMTQEQCERLIELADMHGGWGSLSYDKFPAQEIRMKELGLWEELEQAWQDHIVPTVEKYWRPLEMYGLRDGFVMRYAMDTQKKLNLHHDASLVTGSVKLNNDYVGAELIYPRQGFSNKDIPVGKCILFPGQVTHGHECLPLMDGVKYSLTIWSQRFPGDKL
jgi:GR25 family glycosyltransferase involved in LPS biosynthesis